MVLLTKAYFECAHARIIDYMTIDAIQLGHYIWNNTGKHCHGIVILSVPIFIKANIFVVGKKGTFYCFINSTEALGIIFPRLLSARDGRFQDAMTPPKLDRYQYCIHCYDRTIPVLI